jgi:hypothetical protein
MVNLKNLVLQETEFDLTFLLKDRLKLDIVYHVEKSIHLNG